MRDYFTGIIKNISKPLDKSALMIYNNIKEERTDKRSLPN